MAPNSSEVDQVVARTLRDSLAKLQQTTGELDQAIGDLVSACASSRPSNSLPPMLRARSAAASLAASLEVLSKFVVSALQSAPSPFEPELLSAAQAAVLAHPADAVEPAPASTSPAAAPDFIRLRPAASIAAQPQMAEPATTTTTAESPARMEPAFSKSAQTEQVVAEASQTEPVGAEAVPQTVEPDQLGVSHVSSNSVAPELPVAASEAASLPPAEAMAHVEPASPPPGTTLGADAADPLPASTYSEGPSNGNGSSASETLPVPKVFDILALAPEQQELHRRASRVAKVSMQDVKMLRPRDVALGKENKDLCVRLRDDIEKAHKEYDRRFHAIMDHPVDYFYDWMVQILGDGDPETLGQYPYPSPQLRR